jgi:hypothetical protein
MSKHYKHSVSKETPKNPAKKEKSERKGGMKKAEGITAHRLQTRKTFFSKRVDKAFENPYSSKARLRKRRLEATRT